jgi:hypothetical protein
LARQKINKTESTKRSKEMKKVIVAASMALAILLSTAITAKAEETTPGIGFESGRHTTVSQAPEIPAEEAAPEIGFEITTDFMSKYIWRGQNLSDDYVFQPCTSLSYGSITAGIWGNWDMTSINDNDKQFSELDYSIDYSNSIPGIEGLGFSVGAIYYDFPSTDIEATTELYWGLNLDTFLSPAVTVYHDIDEADGTYVSFSVGHTIDEIAKIGDTSIAMEIGASVGWGNSSYDEYYWGVDSAKVNDYAVSLAFPMDIVGWTFTPSVRYSAIASSDLRETDAYSTDSDYVYTGLSLSKAF